MLIIYVKWINENGHVQKVEKRKIPHIFKMEVKKKTDKEIQNKDN